MKNLLCVLCVIGLGGVAGAAEPMLAPGFEPVAYQGLAPVADGSVAHGAPAGRQLYCNVEVKDRHNMHPCAVSKIVEVPDPCNPCCCVLVEICVPPCECECVERKDDRVTYDYGDYEVEIRAKKGRLVVDYDD